MRVVSLNPDNAIRWVNNMLINPRLSKNEYLQISLPHPSAGPRGYSDVTQVFWDAAFITSNSRTAFGCIIFQNGVLGAHFGSCMG